MNKFQEEKVIMQTVIQSLYEILSHNLNLDNCSIIQITS